MVLTLLDSRRAGMSHVGVLVGYARTSTTEQRAGLEAQLRDLKAAGCAKVFKEQVSSIGERAQLQAALEYVRAMGGSW
jgi:DNA invertase Pin-like site-specific DNA recombinase